MEGNSPFGDSGEMPEPEDLKAFLQQLSEKTLDTGLAHDTAAEEIMPTAAQLKIEPGHLVHTYDISGDGVLMVGEVIDPETQAEQFPDWQTRLEKYYILGRWRSSNEPLGEAVLGWEARSKLIQVDQDQYNEILRWIESNHVPEEGTDWWYILVSESLHEAAEMNPRQLFKVLDCNECGSHGVVLKVVKTITAYMRPGFDSEDENPKGTLFELSNPREDDEESSAEVFCVACGFSEPLPRDVKVLRKGPKSIVDLVSVLRL